MGAKTVPFMALGPAGGAVSEAVGGGAAGLAAQAAQASQPQPGGMATATAEKQ